MMQKLLTYCLGFILLTACSKKDPDTEITINHGPQYYFGNCYDTGFPSQWTDCKLTQIAGLPAPNASIWGQTFTLDDFEYDSQGRLTTVLSKSFLVSDSSLNTTRRTLLEYKEDCSRIEVYQDPISSTIFLPSPPLVYEYVFNNQRLTKLITYNPNSGAPDTNVIYIIGYNNDGIGGVQVKRTFSFQPIRQASLFELDDFGNIIIESILQNGLQAEPVKVNYTFHTDVRNPMYSLPYPALIGQWQHLSPNFMHNRPGGQPYFAWTSQPHQLPDSAFVSDFFPHSRLHFSYDCP